MQKRTIIVLTAILFMLMLLIGSELYWLKKPEKQETKKENNAGTIKNTAVCEFKGKVYQPGEFFLARLSTGCGICRCGEDSLPVCGETRCPKEAPNE